tara:strand:+ start:211 stop:753 length:543 start_codon:yes stop_codon:yes gene_type:complete
MAFTMNKDRINLRGSADTPGSFSTDHTGKISEANPMADGVPDGQRSQGEAMSPHFQRGGKSVNEIESKGVDIRTGGQLVPRRGDLTEEQNDDVLMKSFAKVPAHTSGKRKKLTDKDKANIVNTGALQGSAAAAGNELERTQGKKDALRKATAKRKKEREAALPKDATSKPTPTNMNKGRY